MQRDKPFSRGWLRRSIRPERVMAGGFFALILVGTLLLALPISGAGGRAIGLFSSLFTATSAVCVTGLVAVDTGTALSTFGQVVLITLIQMGGLGFMVFATLVLMALRRRISLRDRVMIRESLNTSTLSGLLRLTLTYGRIVLSIELMGALLLSIRFIPRYGLWKGLGFSVFHAISAFCNAGFDLFGHFSSLTSFAGDPLVVLTISALIILGGLGFAVIFECVHAKHNWRALTLHTKIVLLMTGSLLLAGTAFFLLAEWNNPKTLGEMDFGGKLLNAFFQSVTMRTAGFNTIDLASMREASKLMSVLLMFVGASPASTGGGVKTTTISVLFFLVMSVVHGQDEVTAMKKRLPTDMIRRALAITFISLMIALVGTMLLTVAESESKSFMDLLFETISALATVGVSAIGTPRLTPMSRVVLLPLMFFGRVGPLTMALALASKQQQRKTHIRYPEERIMIG